MLYCSENISLAILEILVHFDGLTFPSDLSLLHLELPNDKIKSFSKSKFNVLRKSDDAEFRFQIAGKKWLDSKDSLVLKVPSIISPGECNFLVNPKHDAFKSVRKAKIEDLEMDERLFR